MLTGKFHRLAGQIDRERACTGTGVLDSEPTRAAADVQYRLPGIASEIPVAQCKPLDVAPLDFIETRKKLGRTGLGDLIAVKRIRFPIGTNVFDRRRALF